jgi:hypothetical protein
MQWDTPKIFYACSAFIVLCLIVSCAAPWGVLSETLTVNSDTFSESTTINENLYLTHVTVCYSVSGSQVAYSVSNVCYDIAYTGEVSAYSGNNYQYTYSNNSCIASVRGSAAMLIMATIVTLLAIGVYLLQERITVEQLNKPLAFKLLCGGLLLALGMTAIAVVVWSTSDCWGVYNTAYYDWTYSKSYGA